MWFIGLMLQYCEDGWWGQCLSQKIRPDPCRAVWGKLSAWYILTNFSADPWIHAIQLYFINSTAYKHWALSPPTLFSPRFKGASPPSSQALRAYPLLRWSWPSRPPMMPRPFQSTSTYLAGPSMWIWILSQSGQSQRHSKFNALKHPHKIWHQMEIFINMVNDPDRANYKWNVKFNITCEGT